MKYPDKKEAFSYPLTTYPLALSTAQKKNKNCTKPHTKYLFINYLIDSSAVCVEVPSELNPKVTYGCNLSQPTWEDLFKILIKVYKLKESSETILVFDNYTDEFEYSLKEEERLDRAGSTIPLRTYIREISREMFQGKSYQDFLLNTENKSQLLNKFTEYLAQESKRKHLMDRITLNIEKDTVLISQSHKQSHFTSS